MLSLLVYWRELMIETLIATHSIEPKSCALRPVNSIEVVKELKFGDYEPEAEGG